MVTAVSALTVFAGLPVRDLTAASAWYSQVLGRDPDAHPAPGIAEYYLAADHVPEHGTLQLRDDPERAGGGLVTINVEDLSDVVAHLGALSIPFEPRTLPIDAEAVIAVTVGTFEDPDGNAITLVQPHPRT